MTYALGVNLGLQCGIAGLLLAFSRKWKIAARYALIGLASGGIGLAMPSIFDWLMDFIHDDPNLLYWALASMAISLIEGIFRIWLFVLPNQIARKQGKKGGALLIAALSVGSIAVFPLWSIAVFLAYRPDRTADKQPTPPVDS
jgi:hypothetical protein